MCELCGTEEERKRGRESNLLMADKLRSLAKMYDGLAYGRIKPHSDDVKRVESLGRLVVRRLVEDWV